MIDEDTKSIQEVATPTGSFYKKIFDDLPPPTSFLNTPKVKRTISVLDTVINDNGALNIYETLVREGFKCNAKQWNVLYSFI